MNANGFHQRRLGRSVHSSSTRQLPLISMDEGLREGRKLKNASAMDPEGSQQNAKRKYRYVLKPGNPHTCSAPLLKQLHGSKPTRRKQIKKKVFNEVGKKDTLNTLSEKALAERMILMDQRLEKIDSSIKKKYKKWVGRARLNQTVSDNSIEVRALSLMQLDLAKRTQMKKVLRFAEDKLASGYIVRRNINGSQNEGDDVQVALDQRLAKLRGEIDGKTGRDRSTLDMHAAMYRQLSHMSAAGMELSPQKKTAARRWKDLRDALPIILNKVKKPTVDRKESSIASTFMRLGGGEYRYNSETPQSSYQSLLRRVKHRHQEAKMRELKDRFLQARNAKLSKLSEEDSEQGNEESKEDELKGSENGASRDSLEVNDPNLHLTSNTHGVNRRGHARGATRRFSYVPAALLQKKDVILPYRKYRIILVVRHEAYRRTFAEALKRMGFIHVLCCTMDDVMKVIGRMKHHKSIVIVDGMDQRQMSERRALLTYEKGNWASSILFMVKNSKAVCHVPVVVLSDAGENLSMRRSASKKDTMVRMWLMMGADAIIGTEMIHEKYKSHVVSRISHIVECNSDAEGDPTSSDEKTYPYSSSLPANRGGNSKPNADSSEYSGELHKRLLVLWNRLKFSGRQRITMVEHYSDPKYVSRMGESVSLWERLSTKVQLKEDIERQISTHATEDMKQRLTHVTRQVVSLLEELKSKFNQDFIFNGKLYII